MARLDASSPSSGAINKQHRRSAETSRKILDASVDLLLDRGYSKFRIADAARKAKLSRGAQSHHFSTKNDLIAAAIDRLFVRQVELSKQDAATISNEDILSEYVRHSENFLSSKVYKVILNLMVSLAGEEQLLAKLRDIGLRSRVPIEQVWANRLVESGVTEEDALVVLGVLGAIHRGMAVGQGIWRKRMRTPSDQFAFTLQLLNSYLAKAIDQERPQTLVKDRMKSRPDVADVISAERKADVAQTRLTRGEKTRSAIIEAALEVLIDDGCVGFRSAKLVSASGVSQGGLQHHFPHQSDVIVAVYEHIEKQAEARTKLLSQRVGSADFIQAMISDASERYFGGAYRVQMDIAVAYAENRQFQKLVRSLSSQSQYGAPHHWISCAEQLGLDQGTASNVVLMIWNTVRGLAVRNLVNHDAALNKKIIRLTKKLAESVLEDVLRSSTSTAAIS